MKHEESRTTAARVYAATLHEQARLGGLRFESYLPGELAEWLLAKIASGAFADPSEAVFVMLGGQRDLEPHADLREELERRCVQASLNDPRPRISHEEVKALLKRLEETPRPAPAVWDKFSATHQQTITKNLVKDHEYEGRSVKTPEDWLFGALLHMVLEHCERDDGTYDSFERPGNTEALRLLAEAGFFHVDSDTGDRMRAIALPKLEAFLAWMEQDKHER